MSDMGDIANMRAAAKAWRANAIASGETVRAHDKIDVLIDEVERLRAALLTIRTHTIVHMGDYDIMVHDEDLNTFIDRALEQKP